MTASEVVTLLVATHLYWPRYLWPGPTLHISRDSLVLESWVMVRLVVLVSCTRGTLYHTMLTGELETTEQRRLTSSQEPALRLHFSWIVTTGGSAANSVDQIFESKDLLHGHILINILRRNTTCKLSQGKLYILLIFKIKFRKFCFINFYLKSRD